MLNVHRAAKEEVVLNIGETLRAGRFQYAPGTEGRIHLSLLHFARGVLACLCEVEGHSGAWLFALNVNCRDSSKSPIIFFRLLLATNNLWVRHNGRHLYYGTLSVPTPDGHLEWLLHGVDLKTGSPIDTAIHLKGFAGSEIGQSVCFEIHGNFLYAVSNQTSVVAEEVDWTSFYCCTRIFLAEGKKTPIKRIWRRQHREGPINDSWTDLSLQLDGETGDLIIVECRREWQNGGSENFRTYYSQHLHCFEREWQKHSPSLALGRLPQNEPLTSTLGPNDKPNYEPARKRIRRHYHPEYSSDDNSPDRRDFILAKTKYHTYNRFTSTFLDIINDPPAQSTFAAPPDRLRLRIGSRKRKSPIDENGDEGEKGFLYPLEHAEKEPENTSGALSDERFVSRGIHLWPPPDAPSELLNLLCPSKKAGRVEAIFDSRTLIYSTEAEDPDDPRPIILVNFDPCIQLEGLKRLSSQTTRPVRDNTPVDIDRPRPSECPVRWPQAVGLPGPPLAIHPRPPQILPPSHPEAGTAKYVYYCFHIQPAMYIDIDRGYWLR